MPIQPTTSSSPISHHHSPILHVILVRTDFQCSLCSIWAEHLTSLTTPGRRPPMHLSPLLPGHIKFVILIPEEESHLINIQIELVDLNQGPDNVLQFMEALPYTWGKPTPTQTVHCCGTNYRYLSISPNLYDAPVGLRSEQKFIYSWIHQICTYSNRRRTKYCWILKVLPLPLEWGLWSKSLG